MSETADEPSDAVIDLQVRVAYQDRLIAQLDEVVRELGDRVVGLERELKELRQRLDDVPEVGPHNEKPPHY